MDIDYKAVVEILENFLKKEKTEILGISVGQERQVRLAIENLIQENKELKAKYFCLEQNYFELHEEMLKQYIPKSKVKEKIEILEKCTTKIDKKVNLTDYMIIGETERAVGRFVNLDFIKKALLEEPGYDIELLEEGE